MPNGTPDYGYQPVSTTANNYDVNAIIASIRNISPLDGRGRMVFIDTFDHGLINWVISNSGGASSPVPDWSRLGLYCPPFSAKFAPVVNGGISTAQIGSYQSVTGNVGFEFGGGFDFTSGKIRVVTYIGTSGDVGYGFEVQITPDDKKVYIKSGGDLLHVATVDNFIFGGGLSYRIKVIGSTTDHNYLRLVIGSHVVDLSAYPMMNGASILEGYFFVQVEGIGYNVTKVNPMYLDYVILTSDEPNT